MFPECHLQEGFDNVHRNVLFCFLILIKYC